MKIKTIRMQLDYAEDFDEEVNQALEEGWLLTRRTVLVPQANNQHIMLYAEMVRDLELDHPAWQDAVRTLHSTCKAAKECSDSECPAYEWCKCNLPKVPEYWRLPDE